MKLWMLLCLSTAVYAQTQCGIRPPNSLTEPGRYRRYIIGGSNVTETTKWPWQVGYENGAAFCGGSIIANQWVLTAAHCFLNGVASEIHVLAGVTHLDYRENGTLHRVSKVIRHENFHPYFRINDIALLKVESPFTYSDAVSPICLPNSIQSIPSDAKAISTGFGRHNPDENSDGQLREVEVPIIPLDTCEERWSTITDPVTMEIRHNADLVCASTSTQGVHKGDSGGPLLMNATDGRWFQIGITSFGEDGDNWGYIPSLYTNVKKYCGWIKENTEGEVQCQDEEVTLESGQEVTKAPEVTEGPQVTREPQGTAETSLEPGPKEPEATKEPTVTPEQHSE